MCVEKRAAAIMEVDVVEVAQEAVLQPSRSMERLEDYRVHIKKVKLRKSKSCPPNYRISHIDYQELRPEMKFYVNVMCDRCRVPCTIQICVNKEDANEKKEVRLIGEFNPKPKKEENAVDWLAYSQRRRSRSPASFIYYQRLHQPAHQPSFINSASENKI